MDVKTKILLIHNNDKFVEDEKALHCPIDLNDIPNKMGINLCAVNNITWTEIDQTFKNSTGEEVTNTQLLSVTINFIPVRRPTEYD